MACVGVSAAFAQTLLIDELMYHPASEELSEQWLELYNPGNVPRIFPAGASPRESAIPSGRHGGRSRFLSGGRLGCGGFRPRLSDVENVLGNWSGNLSKNGEKVELANAAGVVICSVSYSNQGDWARRELTHEEFITATLRGNCEHAGWANRPSW
jgi:hypothetical protein